MPTKPKTIDDYLATVPRPQRAALQKLRKTIHAILPAAEECISYSIPAVRYRGRIVGGFQARTSGCSYFPFSGRTLRTLSDELARYSQTKSALHFASDKPLPKTLVKKLLSARIAEIKT